MKTLPNFLDQTSFDITLWRLQRCAQRCRRRRKGREARPGRYHAQAAHCPQRHPQRPTSMAKRLTKKTAALPTSWSEATVVFASYSYISLGICIPRPACTDPGITTRGNQKAAGISARRFDLDRFRRLLRRGRGCRGRGRPASPRCRAAAPRSGRTSCPPCSGTSRCPAPACRRTPPRGRWRASIRSAWA